MANETDLMNEAFGLIVEEQAQRQVKLFIESFKDDSGKPPAPQVGAFLMTKLMATIVPNLSYVMGADTTKQILEDLKELARDFPDQPEEEKKIIQ